MNQEQRDRLYERLMERCVYSASGCWIFRGTWFKRSRGWLWVNGRWESAARISAAIFLGFDLDSSAIVTHRKDCFQDCVNHEHLIICANRRQALAVQRERCQMFPKLSHERVEDMRLQASTLPIDDLAETYGVSIQAVTRALAYRTYAEMR